MIKLYSYFDIYVLNKTIQLQSLPDADSVKEVKKKYFTQALELAQKAESGSVTLKHGESLNYGYTDFLGEMLREECLDEVDPELKNFLFTHIPIDKAADIVCCLLPGKIQRSVSYEGHALVFRKHYRVSLRPFLEVLVRRYLLSTKLSQEVWLAINELVNSDKDTEIKTVVNNLMLDCNFKKKYNKVCVKRIVKI